MNINSLLKKEGIENIKRISKIHVNVIAKDVAIKLCLAFPEYNFNRAYLVNIFSTLNMYTSKMPNDMSGAKYIFENNSIYFNQDIEFTNIPNIAMHECIHVLQAHITGSAKFTETFSYFTKSIALNEAAVQLMASEANMHKSVEEKYFDISFETISPDFYPLECVLLKELTYFTGTFSLYHSVINNSSLFINTFIAKFNKKIFSDITRNLDKLLILENDLNSYMFELKYSTKPSQISSLTKIVNEKKALVNKLFFDTQNYIIENCFNCVFDNISTMNDLNDFKISIYNFKDVIGYSKNYTYYNDFYRNMMSCIDNKKEEIERLGELCLYRTDVTALAVIDNAHTLVSLLKTFSNKVALLFKSNFGLNRIKITIGK